jgi:hypothetical protein
MRLMEIFSAIRILFGDCQELARNDEFAGIRSKISVRSKPALYDLQPRSSLRKEGKGPGKKARLFP